MEKELSVGYSKLIQTEEIQGLQGSFSIPELVLQKIWLRQDFLHNQLFSYSQKRLQIINPGHWNCYEGPDFKEAEIILDGQRLCGDIEIHFHSNDWFNHGHSLNPNFSNVILHVILFEPAVEQPPVFNSLGFCPETLVLLPYLRQGLEEYALEDILLNFETRHNIEFLQAFVNIPREELIQILLEKALRRWKQKCSFALSRLAKDTWANVCHQMFLETLGFRRNRAPMNALAQQYPIHIFINQSPTLEELFNSQKSNWKLAKLRPANHPKKRLSQYLHLIKENPNWPELWRNFATQLPTQTFASNTSLYRKHHQISKIDNYIRDSLLKHSISGTRFHTIIIDALLPLASVCHNIDLFSLWFHWYSGDLPSSLSSFIHASSILSQNQPTCNGINQAILQLFIETQLI